MYYCLMVTRSLLVGFALLAALSCCRGYEIVPANAFLAGKIAPTIAFRLDETGIKLVCAVSRKDLECSSYHLRTFGFLILFWSH